MRTRGLSTNPIQDKRHQQMREYYFNVARARRMAKVDPTFTREDLAVKQQWDAVTGIWEQDLKVKAAMDYLNGRGFRVLMAIGAERDSVEGGEKEVVVKRAAAGR